MMAMLLLLLLLLLLVVAARAGTGSAPPPAALSAPAGAAAALLSPLLYYDSADHPVKTTRESAAGRRGDVMARAPTMATLHVDCATGSDSALGGPNDPLRSIQRALAIVATKGIDGGVVTQQHPAVIELSEGVCHLQAPLRLGQQLPPTVVRGRGPRSVLSGGRPLTGWKPSQWPGAPTGAVFEVDISDWPTEIKTLRHGTALPPRARYPKLSGNGLTSANWLFAQPWSTHPPQSTGRAVHGLGVDPTKLLPHTNLSALVGSYAHVLGCVEKDVNSQLTKVLSVGGSTTKPTLAIEFRNSFTVAQRFYLENARFALAQGEFYVDEVAGKLFYWPIEPGVPAGVVAPVMDRIVEIEHSQGHLLTNLSFTDTTYFADGFWDGPAQQPSDAAVRINYASGVSVSHCQFLGGLGGYGVAIGNASVDITVEGSLFDSVGQGGVIAFGYDRSPVPAFPGDRPAGNNTQPRKLTIVRNVMSNLGQALIHVAGVAFRAASDSLVAHNRIHKTPRYGIQADSF